MIGGARAIRCRSLDLRMIIVLVDGNILVSMDSPDTQMDFSPPDECPCAMSAPASPMCSNPLSLLIDTRCAPSIVCEVAESKSLRGTERGHTTILHSLRDEIAACRASSRMNSRTCSSSLVIDRSGALLLPHFIT
jgi:hypothetical protein